MPLLFMKPLKFVTFVSWCLVLMISLIWQLRAPAFAQSQPQSPLDAKNILVLHALESNMPLNVRTDRAIMAALEAGGIGMRNQFFEYLDLQRNPGPEYRKSLAEMMNLRYGKRKINVIITLYPEALEFLLKDCREIFPDVPIVALYMAPDYELPKTGHRIIRHVFRTDMKGTLEIALKLVPGAKRVYVVGGVHSLDKKNEAQARQDFKKWEGPLDFRYLSDTSLEEMLAAVSSAPPGTIIFYMAMTGDITGKTYNPRDVAERLRQVSRGPVFGLYETLLGHGIVGGSIVSYGAIGTQAGTLALRMIGIGSDSDKTSGILDIPGVPMFDWRELRHWKLNENALPKGSIVINREETIWDFKNYIIGAVTFCLAETALIIFLIVQRRRRKAAEEELEKFFNVSPDLLCIANTGGYFLRLNPVWERILGYSGEELIAQRFLDFVHPDDLQRTQEAVSAQASGQRVISFENRYRCKDGTYRWLEWSSVPAGNLIYATARDITERELSEEAMEERLRFERLLSDLSARFVNISSDRVDSEIEYGLRQILEFFQVDRAGLMRSLPDRSAYQITHSAYGKDVPTVPVGVELPRSIYPWVSEKLVEKHEVVSFSRLDDLPPEANVDKQTYNEWGVRSALDIPIITGGPVVHVIVINSVKSERVWPEDLFPRLQLLGEIFVNAIERKQIRLQVEERLRFEGLISDLSSAFVNLSLNKIDSQINKGLRAITGFFDADRCTIGLFSNDRTQLERTFEYHSVEAEPGPESILKEQMPWYLGQLTQGKPVVMNRVEDLPPEAEKERQFCLVKGMKSLISIPMVSGGKTLGSFALVSNRAERVWPEGLVQRLRLVCGVFIRALEHKQAEEAVRENERILRQNENDLRRLAGRLIYAQEEERSRLARDLHDDFAQRLAVIAMDVGELKKQLMDPPAPAREQLREMENNIGKLSQDVHSLSRQLHPSILDDLGLVKAVESECMNFSKREGVEIVFDHENISTGIPKEISLSLYRMIQEGLRNISKHACAEHISVTLKGIDHNILLSVQDDGIGFDWTEVQKHPGLGFSSMRERARLIHGELSIQSQPEKGTVITLRVPFTREGK